MEKNQSVKASNGKHLDVDHARIQSAVREILFAVGEDPDREGLKETPARVARMYAEMFSGLKTDPRIHLQKVFTEKYDEVVLVRDIDFCSMCEHHLLPFYRQSPRWLSARRKGCRAQQAGSRRRGGSPTTTGSRADDRSHRRLDRV